MAGKTILEFYPFDVDTITTKEGNTLIRIFGVTKDGKKVIALDSSINPYFYAIVDPGQTTAALDYALKIKYLDEDNRVVQPISVDIVKRKMVGEEKTAIKISLQQSGDIAALKSEIEKMPGFIERAEYDISFVKRYLIDKKMNILTLWRVSGEPIELRRNEADFIINSEKLELVNDTVIENPKIVAFDIETYNPGGISRHESDPIIMIGFSGSDGKKKVITWKKFKDAPGYVEFVDSEKELIESFVGFIKKYQPDIIVGYNSDNFDFPYLFSRAKKYKIKLDIGRDSSELSLRKKRDSYTAKIDGIVHVDIFTFIKNILSPTMKTETYGLSSVAEELIGEKKLDSMNMEKMFLMWDNGEDLSSIAEYNLHDTYITLKLIEKLKYTLFELTKLVGMPLFDVSRMTYGKCVEWYLARRAQKFGEFVPSKPQSKTSWMRSYAGGYVHEPKPGVYNNVAVFDFRSLYPSLIVSHNICPTKISCKCCKEGDLSPEINGKKYSFCKKEKGFIPSVIDNLVDRRARIKEILKKVEKNDPDFTILSARSYALKTVANAMYGYLGFAKSRWYSLECASSITAWGRQVVGNLIKSAEDEGFEVIYADTDSVFLHLKNKNQKVALKFLEKINKSLPGVMELELQGIYPKGLFVSKKSGEGAKKRYVLLDKNGDLIVKGFHSVRRDWSKISKEVQTKVMNAILKEDSEENAVKIIKEVINRLKKGDVKVEDILIHTQLTKKIEDYDSIGPHVAAAIKARKEGHIFKPGQIIKYVVTKGEGSISDRSYTVEDYLNKGIEYDADYYINHQVLPAVEKIFEVLGYSKDELKGKVQTTLEGFFK